MRWKDKPRGRADRVAGDPRDRAHRSQHAARLLAADHRRTWRLSNAQYGFLAGAVWVLSFGVMALFMGSLADRFSRTRVMAAGILIWSVCTAASGAAQSFEQMVRGALPRGIGRGGAGAGRRVAADRDVPRSPRRHRGGRVLHGHPAGHRPEPSCSPARSAHRTAGAAPSTCWASPASSSACRCCSCRTAAAATRWRRRARRAIRASRCGACWPRCAATRRVLHDHRRLRAGAHGVRRPVVRAAVAGARARLRRRGHRAPDRRRCRSSSASSARWSAACSATGWRGASGAATPASWCC